MPGAATAKELAGWLEFAVRTAHEAGRLTLGYFQTGVAPEMKPDDSPVTVADRRAEELIRRRIAERYPEHRVVGEEFGAAGRDASQPCWWIDPIDGTKAFVRGVPLYAVLIGLEVEGRIEAGAAYFPALDEMLCAATGMGAFLNGRRCRVAATERLGRAVVSFTSAGSFKAHGRWGAFQRIVEAAWHSVGWSDAYGHALVASGRADLMLDPVMHPYDCGPFPVILREAGGFFGDWSGRETIHGGEALSAPAQLLPEVLALLRDEPAEC